MSPMSSTASPPASTARPTAAGPLAADGSTPNPTAPAAKLDYAAPPPARPRLFSAAAGRARQAVLPELVPKPQFALAINLNSIALNVARAVGPALFIVVVMFVPGDAGAGVSFLLTALSFVGAVWVLFRWKRPPQRA